MEKKKITMLIATRSEDKIQGIIKAFAQFFPKEEYEINFYSTKAESGVSNQPFGNDTYQGAYNRINHIKEKYKEILISQGIDVDYYVSCEAGIDDTNKVVANGEIITLYASEQVACIYDDKKDTYSFGKSSAWIIPNEDIEEIKNTDLDQYLRARGCRGLNDVGDGKYNTREESVMEATKSAIASGCFVEKCNIIKHEKIQDNVEDVNR